MGIYHSRQLAFAGTVQARRPSPWELRSTFPAWFQMTPPERVGLNGEYDYYGLQKRVQVAFHENIEPHHLVNVGVSQRGRVVILYGQVANRDVLQRLIALATQVEGAIRVEANGVRLENEVGSVADNRLCPSV